MPDPRFSVVVPAYNVERYIEECLDSISAQGRDDVEVVVVDDGSTDSTSAILERWAREQAFINLIRQSNKGLLAARRAGIAVTRGGYVLCVDGDDGLLPGALDVLDGIIRECAPDCITFSHTRRSGSLSRVAVVEDASFTQSNRDEMISLLARTRSLNSIWSKCVRRECMGVEDDFARFGRIQNGEDLIQSVSIIERSRSFAAIEAPLYYYRANEASITRTFRESDLSDVVVARGELHAFLERECASPGLERAACSVDYMQAVDTAQSLCLSSTPWEQSLEMLDEFIASGFYQRAVTGCGGIGSLRLDYRPLAPLLTKRRYGAFRVAARVRAATMSAYRSMRERKARCR